MDMNLQALKQFLIDCNAAGYAGGDDKKWLPEPDGSTTIPYVQGPWRSSDNFFGGEPYGGRVIVFYHDKPYWMMVYYGWVAEDVQTNPVYAVLRNALMAMPDDYPYRGPNTYTDGEYTYTNAWDGEVDRFTGTEEIHHSGRLIYQAEYAGGLVDQRRGV